MSATMVVANVLATCRMLIILLTSFKLSKEVVQVWRSDCECACGDRQRGVLPADTLD